MSKKKEQDEIILNKINLEPNLFYSLLLNYNFKFKSKYINYFTKNKNELNEKELYNIELLYEIFKDTEFLEISIEPYIILILSLESYELNNLLRFFIIKWNTLKDCHTENSFVYTLEEFSKIPKQDLLSEFLNILKTFVLDQKRSFFILNSLQNYFYPF
jgi:hypothetical protein